MTTSISYLNYGNQDPIYDGKKEKQEKSKRHIPAPLVLVHIDISDTIKEFTVTHDVCKTKKVRFVS